MFRKADRQDLQNIPAVLSALRIQLEHRDKAFTALLNELGQTAGRIEAACAHESKEQAGCWITLGQRWIGMLQALDEIKSRSDMANNAIVALSGRLTAIENRMEAQSQIEKLQWKELSDLAALHEPSKKKAKGKRK